MQSMTVPRWKLFVLFFLMLSGCAPQMHVYQPKPPVGIDTVDAAIADLRDLFENRTKDYRIEYSNSGTIVPKTGETCDRWSGVKVEGFEQEPGTSCCITQASEAGRLWFAQHCKVKMRNDGIEIPYFEFSYDELIGTTPLSEDITGGYYSHKLFLPRNLFILFEKRDTDAAHRIADDISYIKQHLHSYRNGQLAAFEAEAARYHSLKNKPQISEAQRRYIVQANAFTQRKEYTQAIDAYQKALDVDAVAYPAAYFNLALLSAEKKRYSAAIFNMKKYLALEPDGKDARSSQDKIYEWEALQERK